jgi:hypothetical protein
MIAGNRRAGGFVLALVLIALCLSLLAVFLMRWKTRRPLPGKSTIQQRRQSPNEGLALDL